MAPAKSYIGNSGDTRTTAAATPWCPHLLGTLVTCPLSPAALGSTSGESDSNKVRTKLRKFLQRRPTLQSLRERGYIKGGCWGG